MMERLGNPLLAEIGPSAIRTMYERRRETSIDLSMGQPTLMPDYEPFGEAMDWVRDNGTPYPPNAGLPELREAIARIYGGACNPNATNVCVTNGSQEGIYLAIKALLDPSTDEVLLMDPGYPSYARCCNIEGIKHRFVPLKAETGFAIQADVLVEALEPATRMIIFGSPANPTGSVVDEDDVRRLAGELLARKRPPLWVVVDEVYRELTFTDKPYVSLLDHYPYAIGLQSLSKSCALTGMRIGFAIGPAEAVSAMTRAHALMLMSVNVFAQHVALAIVRQPQHLRAHYDWYARQRALVIETATKLGLQFIEPRGAFYAMVRLPPSWASSEIAAEQLLQQYDVVTVPGHVFGEQSEGYLRISWSAQPADLTAGLTRIAEFCNASR
jgi:aminotransferase